MLPELWRVHLQTLRIVDRLFGGLFDFLPAETIQMLFTSHEQSAVGDSGAGHDPFIELRAGQKRELRFGGKHERMPVFTEGIDPVFDHDGGQTSHCLREGDCSRFLSCFRHVASGNPGVVDEIQMFAPA